MAASAATAGKPAGKVNLIVTVGVLTVLAIVGGGIVGKLIAARQHAGPAQAVAAPAKPLPYADDTEVRELTPIVTNLAAPAGTRVRLQVSIVFGKKAVENPAVLTAQISDDIVAFLKSLPMSAIEGASGLQALREDLNERASVRSSGKVREVIIETLVVQ